MPSAVGYGGADYLWRDGSVSSLAPPSGSIDEILSHPTEWAVDNETALSYDRIYREQPIIGAACRLLAEQVARIPLKAFIRAGDGDRDRDRESKFARALRRPYPRRSSFDLKRDIALDLVVNGNHIEEIIFENGNLRLRSLIWRKCKPIYNEAKSAVIGWEIWDQADGQARRLSNFDIIHFKLGNPGGLLGISPLEQLGITVRIDRAAQAHQLATLRNGGRVGVVVKIDEKYAKNPDVVALARREFEQRFTPKTAGRPYVAAGVDLVSLPQQSLVEAELIEQRKVGREEASAVLQLPTLFLGDLGKATMNNYAEAHRQLFKLTLAGMFDLIVSTFDAQLLDEHPHVAAEESYCEFDVSAILFGDPLERAKAYRELQAAGGLTVNEVRGLENRPKFPYAWADDPILPGNNLVAAGEDFGEHTQAPAPPPVDAPPEDTPDDQ